MDTNLFVSGTILRRGIPFNLLEAWRAGVYSVLLSAEQRAELEDVFSGPRIQEKYAISAGELASVRNRLNAAPTARLRRRLPVKVRDPKDEKILAAALGAKADYLVTGDEDLLVLRHDPRIRRLKIVTAREFLEIILARGGSP